MNKKTPWHEKKGARVIISEKLQMTHAGVSQWIKRGVPPDRIIQLCEALDWEYSPHDINPEIYPNANDALPLKREIKMADEVDTTSDRIETETRRRIEAIQHEAPIAIPTGHCLECDEPVPSGHRWCGPECRDMWCARNEA